MLQCCNVAMLQNFKVIENTSLIHTDERTNERTDEGTGGLLELLSQLKNGWSLLEIVLTFSRKNSLHLDINKVCKALAFKFTQSWFIISDQFSFLSQLSISFIPLSDKGLNLICFIAFVELVLITLIGVNTTIIWSEGFPFEFSSELRGGKTSGSW